MIIIIRSHRRQRSVASTHPGVSTTASTGPLGANAKRCVVAVGDLMKPRVAWATCSRRRQPGGQEPVRIAATCDNARVVVESYHMAEQWVSPPRNDVPDTGQVGNVDRVGIIVISKCNMWLSSGSKDDHTAPWPPTSNVGLPTSKKFF